MKVFFFCDLKQRVKLAFIFSIIIFTCLFSARAFAVDILSYSLIAGQNITVGEINVWNDDEFLYVKYMTADGWKMAETKMQFATSLDSIPQFEGNPLPGLFDYKMAHDPMVEKYTFTCDLNELEPGDSIFIAAHADVALFGDKKKPIQEETAWGEGASFPGYSWATYFEYQIQSTDTVSPSISITNPVNNSVITDANTYITIEFIDDDSGIDLSSFSVQIDDTDYTSSFNVTDTRATYRVSTPFASGEHTISVSLSDNSGNTSTVDNNFTVTSSTAPIKYLFSVKNNQWIFASAGDGTCKEYLSVEDLGVSGSADLVGLSRVTPAGKIYFALYDQGGIRQSFADGSNDIYFDNMQLGLEETDQVLAGHIGLDGASYFVAEGKPDIWHSSGDNTNSFFLESVKLGIADSDQIKCLHIGYDNKIYFCYADEEGIFQSIGDGTTPIQFVTSDDLGVPGSTIDAFAIYPEEVSPTLTITHPMDGAFLSSTTPNITVSFQDSGSGIDTNSFHAEINGVDMTSAFAVSETGASYQVPADSPLPVGDNTLEVKIRDHIGNEATADSNFSIGILRAIPGATPTSGTAPLTVHFTTDGIDPAGTIQRFRWDFDGNGSYDTYDEMARDYNHTYYNPGTYNATLYVWSSTGASTSASITITVQNNPPTATADIVPSNGEVPLTAQLIGSGSDPDGSIVLYEWDFDGDGTYDWSSATTGNTTHTYTTVGSYQAVFRVTDSDGQTATALAATTVVNTGPPGSPTATASATPTTGNAPLNVNFNGTATDPNSDDIVLYEWDFDSDDIYDWSSASTGATSHTYTQAGTHVAKLRVTDSTGLTGVDQIPITVNIQTSLSVQNDTVGFFSGTGMTATASSQYSSSYAPSRAIDGNTGTYWHSANESGSSNSYFEVSFNTPQLISAFTVMWYSTSYMYTNARVDIFDAAGTNIYSQETALSGSNSQVSLPSVGNASRLRLTAISKSNSSWTVIREFQVNSTPMPGSQPEPTGTTINTSISADSQVSILIKDENGNVVRTLVNNEQRTLGNHSDYWDCRDDSGAVVNDGAYYAVMQYIVDGQVRSYDLTNSTGGGRYNPPRENTGGSTSYPKIFEPFEDEFLPVNFTLSRASEVTLFVGILYTTDIRIKTVINRMPLPAGNHTIYWDGTDDNGNIAQPPPGNRFVLGIWGYYLPDNAIFMTGGKPVITDVSADPNYYSPFSEKCDSLGNGEGIVLTYSLSEAADNVELRVYSLETGSLLRTAVQTNIPAGENTFFWDGKNNNGEYVDIGDYQLGLIATDRDGNTSMLKYALTRIDY